MAKSNATKQVSLRFDPAVLKSLDALLVRMFGDNANRTWAIEKAVKEFIERMEVAAAVIEKASKTAATDKAKKR